MDPLFTGCILLRNSFAHGAMTLLGYYGHALVGVPLALGLLALGYQRQNLRFKQAGMAVLVSIACAGVLTELLKHLFQLPRPRSFGSYGFPSGHAGTAFSLAAALSVSFPALTPVVFLLATLTAISRLYLRAHFLIDVIVGGLIGALVGYFIAQKLAVPVAPPAPSWSRRIGWFLLGIIAFAGAAFFYVIEAHVRAYKVTNAAQPIDRTGSVSFDFGTPAVRRVLGSGWSVDELWQDGKQSVVWAEGTRARMSAWFPAASPHRWRLHLFPHTGRGPACQTMEIKVNDAVIVKMLLEQGWHWYEFDLLHGVIQRGENNLEFRFHYADSPRSQRRGADSRSLSVAFDILEAIPQR